MEAHNENLKEILLFLAAAVVVVAAFRRLNLSPVLGYLAAGIAIGPYGLGIISSVEGTNHIAEYGVVFLLFYIGLELTFDRLKSMRKHVFGFGTSQLLITSLIIWFIAHYIFKVPTAASIIIGGGLALSSTAIVLQVLVERGEQASQVGRLSLAVLILQDLAVVPLLVLVPLLADPKENILLAMLEAITKTGVALVVIFFSGRLLLRPLFRMIGALRSQELFAATTILIVLGSAWCTANVGLSLALGAFMAGLMVAETEFRHQVEADIMPFKGLLLGLFFMSVGMSIDIHFLLRQWPILLAAVTILIMIKALIIIGLCYLFRFKLGNSIHAGLILSQGGEFAFVLFGIASQSGLMPRDIAQILLVVITLTMALTPLLAIIGDRIENYLDGQKIVNIKDAIQETIDLENHAIIAGFGRMGKTVAKLLSAEKVNYIALDTNPKNVYSGHLNELPVYYGDSSRLDVLHSVGIERARVVIITTNNKIATLKTLQTIRREFPDIPVIIRSKDIDSMKELEVSGATLVIPEVFETSLQIGAATLKYFATPDYEINRIVQFFRSGDYAFAKELTDNEKSNTEHDPVI